MIQINILHCFSLCALLSGCIFSADPGKSQNPGTDPSDTGGPGDTGPGDTGDSGTGDTGDSSIGDSDTGTGDSDTGTGDSDTGTGDTGDTGDTGTPDLNQPPTAEECGDAFPDTDPASYMPPAGFGPYWREDTPERPALNIWQESGTRLILSLRVLNLDGVPQAGQRVTVWSVAQTGQYDTGSADANGYGWQVADAEGRVCFSMLRPLNYTDGMGGYNPAHIHLAVGPDALEANQELGTQLYFAGDPWLTSLQSPELQATPEILPGGERIRYDVVLGAFMP